MPLQLPPPVPPPPPAPQNVPPMPPPPPAPNVPGAQPAQPGPGAGPPPSPTPGPAAGGAPGAPPAPQGAAPPGADDSGAAGGDETPSPQPPGQPNALDPVRPRLIPGSDAKTGSVPASPQEQHDLHQTVAKALQMIHGQQSRDAVLNALHDPSSTVAETVGRVAANILMTASQQKRAMGGGQLQEEVLQQAARYVVPELMDVGIAAGIFPLQPPGGAKNDQAGVGTDTYNREIRMAMLEATKVYGQTVLKQPGAAAKTEQAQNDWARGVSMDVQAGKASPKYMRMVRPQGPSGAPQLIDTTSQQPQGAAPPGGAADAA